MSHGDFRTNGIKSQITREEIDEIEVCKIAGSSLPVLLCGSDIRKSNGVILSFHVLLTYGLFLAEVIVAEGNLSFVTVL